jgi:hypothetical protein
MQVTCKYAAVALAAAALLPAQHITEPPDLLRPGSLAVEAGVPGPPLLRFGVAGRLEVRFDSGIGAKVRLVGEGRLRPAVSVTASSRDRDVTLAWMKTLPRGSWAAGSMARQSHALAFGREVGRGFGAYGEAFRDAGAWGADAGLTRALGKSAAVEAGIGRTRADGWFAFLKLTREFGIRPREK